MPVYELKIDGAEKPRMVKADTAAQARNTVVSATPITAERMAELLEEGVKLEKPLPASPESSDGETGDGDK